MESHASIRNRSLLLLALAGAVTVASPAAAQPAPSPPPPAAPPGAALLPAPALPAPPPDNLALSLAPKPGGLTPEAVAKTVAQTKHSVRAKQEELKAAAAKVDQAFVGFFPRVSVSASYTPLSPISYPSFGTFLGYGGPSCPPALPAGVASCTQVQGTDQTGKPTTAAALGIPFTFPNPPVDNYSLTASIAVPVSDYVFRLAQGHAAASHNEKSARFAAEAEALQAGADGKIAYFNWIRAKGAIVVSQEAIDQASAHLEDVKKQFNVAYASRADVLRVDAQVAAAQQALAESTAFAAVAEEQLRILLGAPAGKPLTIGSDVMNEPASPPGETLTSLQDNAMARRLEIRSLDEAISSLKQVEAVTKAGYYPRLDAFADATYANPNQRIFPATNAWNGTWDAGLRLSWTLNDTFTTIGAAAEAKSRTLSTIEQRANLQDGLRTEVASAYVDAIKAPATIAAADRGMVAAEESLRVRRELFRNGKATSTEVLDAEGEVTQARLRRLDAHIGLLVARARLDHATGRDAPARPAAE